MSFIYDSATSSVRQLEKLVKIVSKDALDSFNTFLVPIKSGPSFFIFSIFKAFIIVSLKHQIVSYSLQNL